MIEEMARLVEAGRGCFFSHRRGGRLQRNEEADLRFFALHVTLKGRDLVALHMSAFDLHDDALGLAAAVVEEVNIAVNAGIGAFLFVLCWAGVYQAKRPPFELVAVVLRQRGRARQVFGVAEDGVGAQLLTERVAQAVADECDGDMGDVDADPVTVEPFGRGDGRAAAAEGVEDDVALVAAGVDDAFEQRASEPRRSDQA